MKITLDFLMKWDPEETKKNTIIVRVLKPFRVALPDRNLTALKEDVLTLDGRVANILRKGGYVEFINIDVEKGEIFHDMGKVKSEDMANVEG